MLVGCSAGFLNVAKIKGTQNAMKSGMLAAEAIYSRYLHHQENFAGVELQNYRTSLDHSYVMKELFQTRNFKSGFKYGLFFGLGHGTFINATKGHEPWTFRNLKSDSSNTKEHSKFKPKQYPKPDGVLTFDLMTNLQKSGTDHDHDQPPHLKVIKVFNF